MTTFQFVSDYKENDLLRLSFNRLANEVFGIDFERWYQAGLWNDRYVCYSYVQGDQVVANVSISRLEMILAGERKRAVQIGTVMTHPAYRGQGLASGLLRIVLDEVEPKTDVVYLFPDDDAVGFYQRFGFRSFTEGKFIMDVAGERAVRPAARKLDLSQEDDLQRFVRLSAERAVLSDTFDILHAEGIAGWYGVGELANDLYYLEEQDQIVICRMKQNVLHVFDLMSRERVHFYDLFAQLGFSGISRVVFHFTPDFPDTDRRQMAFEPGEMIMFRPESFRIEENFSYPLTAHA